jgi:hypothetical protein
MKSSTLRNRDEETIEEIWIIKTHFDFNLFKYSK